MTKGPIRRGQLIAPFGVGAMVVVRNGLSLISAGLDHWFKSESEDSNFKVDEDEYKIEEWRLQTRLGVNHFRLPPDYRRKSYGANSNINLTIPFLRFPQWHVCPFCHLLNKAGLSERSKVPCPSCKEKQKKRYMIQVDIIAMCDKGHIQDFPWREWVHNSISPTCKKPMRLISTGRAALAGKKVKCDCGLERSLTFTVEVANEHSGLSKRLSEKEEYLCQGHRPWLGIEEGSPCSGQLQGALKSATNVYFSCIKTAIYLPRKDNLATSDLVSLLEEPYISEYIKALSNVNQVVTAAKLRKVAFNVLVDYSDEKIESAIKIIVSGNKNEVSSLVSGVDDEVSFRRAEFEALREPREEEQLLIRKTDLSKYDPEIAKFFSRIMLVDKLRETRVLVGFSRIFPENQQSLEEKKQLLWRYPDRVEENWLPAYTVFGEGIYLELDLKKLEEWENRQEIIERIGSLDNKYRKAQRARNLPIEGISPRLVLLHSFTHLLINRLTFECGYSSASLRERLYISTDTSIQMAGVLIYTAAGDSEGTMGGLVRMGKPGRFEPLVRRALESAEWCSSDPVCMEIGSRDGQGPDACNLAACHGCALIPEIACERFNRLLDRTVVVGTYNNSKLGFFVKQN
ncbi:MAG: DUF1998 domain-containing protein [Blastocatellia bacterium]